MKTTKTTTSIKLKTNIKAGPNRRAFDHIGNFNFNLTNNG